jgi:hypothetical protein
VAIANASNPFTWKPDEPWQTPFCPVWVVRITETIVESSSVSPWPAFSGTIISLQTGRDLGWQYRAMECYSAHNGKLCRFFSGKVNSSDSDASWSTFFRCRSPSGNDVPRRHLSAKF